jgi:hypothetical protein
MTRAPISIVAGLRETSVLFAAAIAVIVPKEPVQAVRVVARDEGQPLCDVLVASEEEYR